MLLFLARPTKKEEEEKKYRKMINDMEEMHIVKSLKLNSILNGVYLQVYYSEYNWMYVQLPTTKSIGTYII